MDEEGERGKDGGEQEGGAQGCSHGDGRRGFGQG
jgi:hypothetical protein